MTNCSIFDIKTNCLLLKTAEILLFGVVNMKGSRNQLNVDCKQGLF